MTEVCQRMLTGENEDSPTKCRERRRRRIKMRRVAGNCASGSGTLSSPSEKDNRIENSACVTKIKRLRASPETSNMPAVASSSSTSSGDNLEPVASDQVSPSESHAAEPVYGAMLVSGRAHEMEDAISVWTSFCRPDINQRRPLHFFVVYDGHGGPHVAALCKERMPVFFEEELMHVRYDVESESREGSSSRADEHEQEAENADEWKGMWRRVIAKSFQRMDDLAITTCACGGVGQHNGECHAMVALGGSTAVVAVLTSQHVIVANCGDSRAVLCRGGTAIPLSCDHKPDRPDELARIEAAGGRVIFANGARVEGILAMSRAIGDKYLKPVVISDPEITFTKREPEDECLILASDGLWDVLSSDLACEVASECLRERNRGTVVALDGNARPRIEDEEAETLYPSRSALAAAVLTRLALGRKSFDNISVIVVDLKKNTRNR